MSRCNNGKDNACCDVAFGALKAETFHGERFLYNHDVKKSDADLTVSVQRMPALSILKHVCRLQRQR